MAKIPDHVVKAIVTDLNTGVEFELETKPESGCHFFERFSVEGYEVGLRLDWTDIDANGDPMLDADFFLPGSQRPIKRMKKIAAHHTPKNRDVSSGKYSYQFEFESLRLRLMPQITNIRNQTGKARIVAAENPNMEDPELTEWLRPK